jgi:hypothetical protein
MPTWASFDMGWIRSHIDPYPMITNLIVPDERKQRLIDLQLYDQQS